MAALKAKREKVERCNRIEYTWQICDSSIANIFIVKIINVFTPALSEGCVAGIMRKHIIQQLQKANWEIVEKEIQVDELLTADEVF
jgi:branched-chain amino acid aminotransferase